MKMARSCAALAAMVSAVLMPLAAKDPVVEYLDIYTPMKAHPGKQTLFRPDGVHLSAKGHAFVADIEFAHIAK
jgi:lysophospholipase L1-like esterase